MTRATWSLNEGEESDQRKTSNRTGGEELRSVSRCVDEKVQGYSKGKPQNRSRPIGCRLISHNATIRVAVTSHKSQDGARKPRAVVQTIRDLFDPGDPDQDKRINLSNYCIVIGPRRMQMNARCGGLFPILTSTRSPTIRYPIPQEAGNVLVMLLVLRGSMGDGDLSRYSLMVRLLSALRLSYKNLFGRSRPRLGRALVPLSALLPAPPSDGVRSRGPAADRDLGHAFGSAFNFDDSQSDPSFGTEEEVGTWKVKRRKGGEVVPSPRYRRTGFWKPSKYSV
ncbi:hypothetical protein EVAR_89586_1 [Eumeta japonica]|uniref:Uncharacterized protein n=1 Tax=Eumeta variegata TaxID=151549 RepID=A0A4C1XN31_EUMVA|nr:hypothetical protein EVAR_89586_1 [Eumeta japonica]